MKKQKIELYHDNFQNYKRHNIPISERVQKQIEVAMDLK